MRPRRDVSALDYLEETLDVYERALSTANTSPNEDILWAHDVLERYFEEGAHHPVVNDQKERFLALASPSSDAPAKRVPHPRGPGAPPPFRYEEFLALARRRKSVRWFQPQPVPRERVDRAVVAASCSPSACNRQPFVFRVLDDPELVGRVAAIPMGTAGYAENIPMLVAVVGELRAFFSERDRHLVYIDGSLATMSLLLALEAQGLSTCCINWPDLEDRETALAEALQLAPHERPIMLVAVGYADPDGQVGFSQKKTLDRLRRYNLE
jgi:nitroreductase